MPRTALGVMIQTMREERGLSLRELGQLANTDHAYIYRLETGDKESPSDEVITKLVRALKLEKRDADILRFAAAYPKADPSLVEYVAKEDRTVSYEVFAAAAGTVFRAKERPDYATIIRRVRRILEEEQDDR
jgi:HTH-type transcriptional regulator, competence development regulator